MESSRDALSQGVGEAQAEARSAQLKLHESERLAELHQEGQAQLERKVGRLEGALAEAEAARAADAEAAAARYAALEGEKERPTPRRPHRAGGGAAAAAAPAAAHPIVAGARRAHELIEAVAAPAAADGLAAALDAGSMSRAQLYGEYQAAAEALAAAKADKEAMGETLHRVLAELDAKARAAAHTHAPSAPSAHPHLPPPHPHLPLRHPCSRTCSRWNNHLRSLDCCCRILGSI